MTDVLDDEALAAGFANLGDQQAQTLAEEYRFYSPLSAAAAEAEREAKDGDRLFIGVPAFDDQMRGVSNGHFTSIVGYSHSGKTQWLMNTLLVHNPQAHIMWVCPDEPAPLVLIKLASIESGIPSEQLEELMASDDTDTRRLIHEIANDRYPNLVIVDRPMTGGDMERAYQELTNVWGKRPEAVVFDFVDQLQVGDATGSKFDFLKSFTGRHKTRLFAIHQMSRSKGAGGQKPGIDGGNMGGETHAMFQFGVRRKISAVAKELEELNETIARTGGTDRQIDRQADLMREARIHQYTISVNLNKNKRPGGRLVDEIDFEIISSTGKMRQLAEGELPAQYRLPSPVRSYDYGTQGEF